MELRQGSMEEVEGLKFMRCPFCNNIDTKVVDTRPLEGSLTIRRRRKCEKCSKRFTTYEKLETIPLMVVKKDNTREPYDRSKLELGIIRSCHKRQVSTDTINRLIDGIETTVFNMEAKEIRSTLIGELVMSRLKEIYEVAYVRFASVYREFKDIDTFMEEIGKLRKKNSLSEELTGDKAKNQLENTVEIDE